MREAVGGTWLLYFFFVFIFVYVAFMAVIMNYASAYRTNNYIVSNVENMEGNVNWTTLKNEVRSKYSYTGNIGFCCTKNSMDGVVYRIQTYVMFEVPLINTDIKIPITNDSKTIIEGKCASADICR